MKKYIVFALIVSSSASTAAQIDTPDHTIENLIEQNNYRTLKTVLYDHDYDVLDRASGYSLLDYAMSMHNKRAAIILADYNNSSIPERNIVKIKNTISYLESEIIKNTSLLNTSKTEHKSGVESNILQLKSMKENLMAQINDLQAKVGQVSNDDRITKLEKDVRFLMGNFISVDDDVLDSTEKKDVTTSLKITAKKM